MRIDRLSSPVWPEAKLPAFLDDASRALFARPVVAIHPGVGTVMRQWPAEHFAALVDLLIDAEGVNAVLVGGPDEIALAQEVLDKIVRRDAVVSLTGRTTLAELTALLACCALYVGNNSGPKHIAAAMGVPTIGIHSGVVDPVEWAPIGRRAMALRRDMTCGPCYLARLEDCPRNLACLRQLEPANVWQACRTMLATGRMPEYSDAVTLAQRAAAVAAEAPVVGEIAVDSGTTPPKRRAGRKRVAGKTVSPALPSSDVVDAVVSTDGSIDAPAKVVEAPTSEPPTTSARTKDRRTRRKAAATPLPAAAEQQDAVALPVVAPDEPNSIQSAAPAVTSEAHPASPSDADVVAFSLQIADPHAGRTPEATTASDTSLRTQADEVVSTFLISPSRF